MVDTVVASGATRNERLDLGGADTLRVDGVFSVGDENQTVRFETATDGAAIVNNGLIANTAEEGRAIRFEEGVGDSFTASIDNAGVIRSADDAVQIQDGTVAAGGLDIRNQEGASILSADGQALDLASGGGAFSATVQNFGAIASDSNDGVRLGGASLLSNTGVIAAGRLAGYQTSADGLAFEDDATGSVHNFGGGRILGDRHGVDAGEGSDITVVNGVGSFLVGRNGSGVGSDGSATVVNYGTIRGQFSDLDGTDVNGSTVGAEDGGGPDGINDGDGDGVDVDIRADIKNFGVIQGLGAGGNGSDGFANTSEGIAAGGGVIQNYAGARITGELGILVDDSSRGNAFFRTEIVNDGLIAGTEGAAIRLVSDLDDTISNGGRISGGDGVAISFGSGDNTLVIRDGSSIVGLTEGGDGIDTLDFSERSGPASVNLSSQKATGTGGVQAFEDVVGSAQADVAVGDAGDNRIDGGEGADSLSGGAGDDTLEGGAGADRLIGRSGADTFVFASPLGDGEVDVVTDFASRDDTIELDAAVFLDIAQGGLSADAFALGTAAADADDRIIFDRAEGGLFYDRDGSGATYEAVQFADLAADLTLTNADFAIV